MPVLIAPLFEGVLVTDFWAAYNSVGAVLRQCCHAHLLRELEKTDKNNKSQAWHAFSKKLRRLIMDAIRLRRREDFSPESYAGRIDRIEKRLAYYWPKRPQTTMSTGCSNGYGDIKMIYLPFCIVWIFLTITISQSVKYVQR